MTGSILLPIQIGEPFLTHVPWNHRRLMVGGVIDRERDRNFSVLECGRQRDRWFEPHEMHGADFSLVAMAAFEFTKNRVLPPADRDLLASIEPHKEVEPFFHLLLLDDLNQQCGA